MKKNLFTLGMALGMILVTGFDLKAEELLAKNHVTEEELFFKEIPMVVTASKREQPIRYAPSTIIVITEEEIKKWGIYELGEVFRYVSGVDVMESNPTFGALAVSPRGLRKEAPDKFLLMVDGRSVYSSSLGMSYWEYIPISVENIKRIEVVKGPGSVLYGANAYSGLINIITKSPDEMKGTTTSVSFGSRGSQRHLIGHGGKVKNLKYLLSLWREKTDGWGKDDPDFDDDYDTLKGNIKLEYNLNEDSNISLYTGGVNHGGAVSFPAAYYYPTEGKKDNTDEYFADLQYTADLSDRMDLRIRTYMDITDIIWTSLFDGAKFLNRSYHTEVQQNFKLTDTQIFTYGAEYRYFDTDCVIFKHTKEDQNFYALYLQDEIKALEDLVVTLGARYDDNSLTGEEFSPRISGVYSIGDNHILRASYSTAFRNPSLLESYFYREIGSLVIHGNEYNKPEKIKSYETGYQYLGSKFTSKISLFYNKMEDSLQRVVLSPTEIAYINVPAETTDKGFELELEKWFTSKFSAFANYSYQDIEDPSGKMKDGRDMFSPVNKANLGLRLKPEPCLSIDAVAHYVDTYVGQIRGTPDIPVDDYTTLNLSILKSFIWGKQDFEMAFLGLNILENKHYEHPAFAEIGSTWIVKFSGKF